MGLILGGNDGLGTAPRTGSGDIDSVSVRLYRHLANAKVVDARLVPLASPILLASGRGQVAAAGEPTADERLRTVLSANSDASVETDTGRDAREADRSVAQEERVDVAITIFACEGDGFCGTMANGIRVHPGAAACGWAFDLGDHFSIIGDPTERVYECEDRGLGGIYWVDVWFHTAQEGYEWLAQVGSYGTVMPR